MRVDPLREQLAELVSARRQLTEDKVSLSNQLDQLRDAMVGASCLPPAQHRGPTILLIDKRLAELVAAMCNWRRRIDLIQSFKGAGPVLSHTLLALAPELGQASRREIAALARSGALRPTTPGVFEVGAASGAAVPRCVACSTWRP